MNTGDGPYVKIFDELALSFWNAAIQWDPQVMDPQKRQSEEK